MDMMDIKIKDLLDRINTINLGVITGIDYQSQRAEIKMLENIKAKDGIIYERPIVQDVVIQYINTKDFEIVTPWQVGDKVVVGFCDSYIKDFMITGEPTLPSSKRRLTGDNPIIISGWRATNDRKIPAGNESDLVIRNKATGHTIKFKQNGELDIDVLNVNVKAVSVNVEANDVTLTAGNTTVNSTTVINGNTTVNGTLNVSSSISGGSTIAATTSVQSPIVTATASMSVNGKDVESHRHNVSGVQGGSSTVTSGGVL